MSKTCLSSGQGSLEFLMVIPILLLGFAVFGIQSLTSYFRTENAFLTQELSACYKSQWKRGDCTRLYRKKLKIFSGHWRLKKVQETQDKISVSILTRLSLHNFQGPNNDETQSQIFNFTEQKPWP